MSPTFDDMVTCPACNRLFSDHEKKQKRLCFLAVTDVIDRLLKDHALKCEVGSDPHVATLMASNGGVYCEVHQPVHTGVVVPDGSRLLLYTVYDRPSDYPDGYVIRRFRLENGVSVPTNEAYTADTEEILEGIRGEMAQCGLTCFPRQPEDDPKIMEVWM